MFQNLSSALELGGFLRNPVKTRQRILKITNQPHRASSQ